MMLEMTLIVVACLFGAFGLGVLLHTVWCDGTRRVFWAHVGVLLCLFVGGVFGLFVDTLMLLTIAGMIGAMVWFTVDALKGAD